MTTEDDDLRTKSFKKKKTLYLSRALCWVEKKNLYLLYEVLVCFLGAGVGVREVGEKMVRLYFMNLFVFTGFIY